MQVVFESRAFLERYFFDQQKNGSVENFHE